MLGKLCERDGCFERACSWMTVIYEGVLGEWSDMTAWTRKQRHADFRDSNAPENGKEEVKKRTHGH